MEAAAASPSQQRAEPVKWLTPLWASLTAAGIAVVAFGLGAGTATAVTHLTDLDRGVSMVSDGRGPGASSLDENGRGPGGPGGFGSAESRDFGSRGMPGSPGETEGPGEIGGQGVPGGPGSSSQTPDSGSDSGSGSEREQSTDIDRDSGSGDSTVDS